MQGVVTGGVFSIWDMEITSSCLAVPHGPRWDLNPSLILVTNMGLVWLWGDSWSSPRTCQGRLPATTTIYIYIREPLWKAELR